MIEKSKSSPCGVLLRLIWRKYSWHGRWDKKSTFFFGNFRLHEWSDKAIIGAERQKVSVLETKNKEIDVKSRRLEIDDVNLKAHPKVFVNKVAILRVTKWHIFVVILAAILWRECMFNYLVLYVRYFCFLRLNWLCTDSKFRYKLCGLK